MANLRDRPDFLGSAHPKQAMEMTECGKHGKPRSRLSTLPTLFGNPFGITTFPRPRLLAEFKVQEPERPNPSPWGLKGVVTQVFGPKLTKVPVHSLPLAAFTVVLSFRKSGSALRAGTGPLRRVAEDATRPQTGRSRPPLRNREKPKGACSCEFSPRRYDYPYKKPVKYPASGTD
jgi:hypothetical protein